MKCIARFSKREGADNLIGNPGRYATYTCKRNATEKVGELSLCAAHARMAREGFVNEVGTVEHPLNVRESKRYGIQPPFTWAKGGRR